MKKLFFLALLLLASLAFPAPAASILGVCPSLMSPAISTDATTGLCTAGTGLVDVYIGGTKILEASSSGVALNVTQSANTFWSGPSSGAAANPTWRAMVQADLPPPSPASIASASTMDLGTACTNNRLIQVTGTTGVTSLGSTAPVGAECTLFFTTVITFTNSATLNLPGATNFSTANGFSLKCKVPAAQGTWYCAMLDNPLVSWSSGGSMTLSGGVNSGRVNVTSTTVPANGIYLPAANTLGFASNTTAAGTVDSTQHWRLGGTSSPTIANNACGSTTQGTIGGSSSDRSGIVTVGTAGVTTCTISFAGTFGTTPRAVILTPANSTAAAQGTTGAYVSSVSTTQFVITGTALAGAAYYYMVE